MTTKLEQAIRRHDLETVRALLAGGASVEKSRWRRLLRPSELTPLEAAVIADAVPIVNCLLDHGADPNGWDQSGTPLQFACGRGLLPIVELLVERGARIDPGPDPQARCPLCSAVTQKHYDVMDWLLAHGANPSKVFSGRVVLNRIPGHVLLRLIEAGGRAPPEIERAVRAGTW